jgi:hypothetical protein
VHQRRSMIRAFLAALLLHVLLIAVTWNTDVVGTSRTEADDETNPVVVVELVDDAILEALTRPQAYTSIPERQEIPEPPSDPDFLALRNSRAADNVRGGEENAPPRAAETGELSQVAILQDTGGSPGGVVVMPVPSGTTGDDGEGGGQTDGVQPRPGPHPDVREGEDVAAGDEAEDQAGEETQDDQSLTAAELADILTQAAPSIMDRRMGTPGDRGFVYDQHAVSLDAGDLIQFGDFGLSTAEWDFAPWLEQFKRDFLPNWIPPYAYTHLGVIDGVTLLRMVIQPDGTLTELDVVEEEGHESLHRASVAAMRATAPLAPLPGHFPDPELVLSVKLIYSAR